MKKQEVPLKVSELSKVLTSLPDDAVVLVSFVNGDLYPVISVKHSRSEDENGTEFVEINIPYGRF
jgi:hypothetical protein